MVILKPDTSAGFNPSLPKGPEFLAMNRDALRLDGRLDASLLGPSIHRLLLTMARLRNVVSTVRIEGEKVDLDGARTALEQQKGKTAVEEQVIRLAKEYTTLHDAKPSKLPRFSVEYILALHKTLFHGLYDEAGPGLFKTKPNGVGDTATGEFVFWATPPERTERELEGLFQWFERSAMDSPGLVTAGVFFAEFEAIHPFHDGNGRVGRLLNLIALKRMGFQNIALTPLDGRYYHTQHDYYAKIASTNSGKTYVPWCRYNSQQVVKAYEIAARRSDLKPLLDQQTRASTRHLLEWVVSRDASPFGHGDFPNPKQYSAESVQKSLAQLVDQEILAAAGERKARRYQLSTGFLRKLYGGSFG